MKVRATEGSIPAMMRRCLIIAIPSLKTATRLVGEKLQPSRLTARRTWSSLGNPTSSNCCTQLPAQSLFVKPLRRAAHGVWRRFLFIRQQTPTMDSVVKWISQDHSKSAHLKTPWARQQNPPA